MKDINRGFTLIVLKFIGDLSSIPSVLMYLRKHQEVRSTKALKPRMTLEWRA